MTPSCTAALEICALLSNAGEGDEVILPSYTFVSTASAFALRGARPIFVDIEPTHLNIDPSLIESSITPRTRALAIVHYGGVACDMSPIMDIVARNSLLLVEDAAHALGGKYQGKNLGTFGQLATFSFHETKNVTCGEGGALFVNDSSLVDRAYIIKDKGTNRRNFQRGDVEYYSWVDHGSSFVMSDILAAFLLAQLECLDRVNERRRTLHRTYSERLTPLKKKGLIQFPDKGASDDSTAHLFFIILPDKASRNKLQQHLKKRDIMAVAHYQPLHLSKFVCDRWGLQPPLPITEWAAERLLRLPLFFSLDEKEQDVVIGAIYEYFGIEYKI